MLKWAIPFNKDTPSLNCVLRVSQDYINYCPNGRSKSLNCVLRVSRDYTNYCPNGHLKSLNCVL